MRVSLSSVLLLAWWSHLASADALDLDIPGARGVGRAGAITVSEDGAASLLLNPAGMARRAQWRTQVGLLVVDSEASYHATHVTDAPVVDSRAPTTRIPQLGLVGPVGPVVIGLAYMETGALSRLLPTPQFNQLPADVSRLYPHRYGGTRLDFRARALLLGVSVRATSWLGVGLTVGASRIELSESRYIWAGFAGRDPLLAPERDLAVTLSGTDAVVPRVGVGVLLAPPHLPLEMAGSLSYSASASLAGQASASPTRQASFPAVLADDATSRLHLAQPLVARTGLRYLGQRLTVELTADLFIHRKQLPVWSVDGMSFRDESMALGAITSVPALAHERSHSAFRIAGDLEIVPGFLWLSTGYARATGASPGARRSPGFADLGGHTLALGAEAQWNGVTLSVGYARTMARTRSSSSSHVEVLNPFVAGTADAGMGRYRDARDVVGTTLELSWP